MQKVEASYSMGLRMVRLLLATLLVTLIAPLAAADEPQDTADYAAAWATTATDGIAAVGVGMVQESYDTFVDATTVPVAGPADPSNYEAVYNLAHSWAWGTTFAYNEISHHGGNAIVDILIDAWVAGPQWLHAPCVPSDFGDPCLI